MGHYQYYNANPLGRRTGDCVKRAITLASGLTYSDVEAGLQQHRKITGASAFNTDNNPDSYVLHALHAVWLSFPAVKGQKRMTGERFCRAYPKGRYILTMAGHWTACIDGVIMDTWDCSRKIVYLAYKFA